MKSEFSRINLLPNYVFAEINQLKAKLRKKGNDIIDFGMGWEIPICQLPNTFEIN